MLRIAVPNKGSLSDPASQMLSEAGYRQRTDHRELVLLDSDNDIEFFFLRPRDVAIYVGSGRLDVGITGEDLLLDSGAAPHRPSSNSVLPDRRFAGQDCPDGPQNVAELVGQARRHCLPRASSPPTSTSRASRLMSFGLTVRSRLRSASEWPMSSLMSSPPARRCATPGSRSSVSRCSRARRF